MRVTRSEGYVRRAALACLIVDSAICHNFRAVGSAVAAANRSRKQSLLSRSLLLSQTDFIHDADMSVPPRSIAVVLKGAGRVENLLDLHLFPLSQFLFCDLSKTAKFC
jgi:hypothetical protein